MKQLLLENKITKQNKIRRMPERGRYDLKTIYEIIDDTYVCNIGFNSEERTFVIPITFGRKDNYIYFHGAKASRMLKTIKTGIDICVAFSILDGIVLARSAFHHSMNYRSVVIFGRAEEIIDTDIKTQALKNILDHIVPGRWDEIREPDTKELNATSVFHMKIDEASAKIRTGPPVDEEKDLDLNVWAGVLPLKIMAAEPFSDPSLNENIKLPLYLKNFNFKK